MKYAYYYKTKIGPLGIAENGTAITDVFFSIPQGANRWHEKETPLIRQAKQQIDEYLDGKRTTFTVPLELVGTPFQKQVWQELQKIPYGQTRSYQQIALAIGNPKAYRAVGMANNKNPIAILVPCHRVIGKNGELVGYAGGIDHKQQLLTLEQTAGKEGVPI